MHQLYYEVRNLPTHPAPTLASDISRHLQTRQYLGRTLVICDNPNAILSAIRKQWFKATRYLQRQRASTLNAEEILRLTHALMHMQNLVFLGDKDPAAHPEGTIFFMSPNNLWAPPENCYTIYIATQINQDALQTLFAKTPPKSLIVTYMPEKPLTALGLKPKKVLEQDLWSAWQSITDYLKSYHIFPDRLVVGNALQFDAMDTALDTLFTVSTEFLREASVLQQAINFNQPLNGITSEQLKRFEAVTRLAHRVQALTPGSFNNFLSVTFGDSSKDVFFLRDVGSELYAELELQATDARPNAQQALR